MRLVRTTLTLDRVSVKLTPNCTVRDYDTVEGSRSKFPCFGPVAGHAGPALEVDVPPKHLWLLGATSEAERSHWREAISDAILLSRGSPPYTDWSLGRTLGTGSFGSVRTALHRQRDEQCACKVVTRSFIAAHDIARSAIQCERRALAQATKLLPQSSGCIRLLEFHETDGDAIFLMAPLCDGDLLSLIATQPLPEPQAAGIALSMLRALAALHGIGFVHLDVKPQNILYRVLAPECDAESARTASTLPRCTRL